jgi:hypothetical protein
VVVRSLFKKSADFALRPAEAQLFCISSEQFNSSARHAPALRARFGYCERCIIKMMVGAVRLTPAAPVWVESSPPSVFIDRSDKRGAELFSDSISTRKIQLDQPIEYLSFPL